MSPVANHLKNAEKKLERLSKLRDAAYDSPDQNSEVPHGAVQNKLRIEDEIEKAYEEYALLKIRYLMDTL